MRCCRTFGSLVHCGLLASLILLPAAASAQSKSQPDPSIGTWKLNVDKSKYSPGPGPKSATVTIKSDGDKTHVTVKTITATGTATSSEYSYRLDGRDNVVTGSADYDTVAITGSGNTLEGKRKKAGRVVQNYKRVISGDGKTMTVTTTGTNGLGQTINNVAVYEKQ
jgi:endonuclease YncB( thermonuclease family)